MKRLVREKFSIEPEKKSPFKSCPRVRLNFFYFYTIGQFVQFPLNKYFSTIFHDKMEN